MQQDPGSVDFTAGLRHTNGSQGAKPSVQIRWNTDCHGREEHEGLSDQRERTFWSQRPSAVGLLWNQQDSAHVGALEHRLG